MKIPTLLCNLSVLIFMLCFTAITSAQADATTAKKYTDQKPAEKITSAIVDNTANNKMVKEATINLQTTVTGNQEQPRVLYILPWQSPAAEDVDFEAFDNQQKAAFSHIEREELRRELESVSE